jgi:hypothetical protein
LGFRDAKPFTGRSDCQARGCPALPFHFYAAMTARTLIKLATHQQTPDTQRQTISIATWKSQTANAYLLERFSSGLGLEVSSIKSKPDGNSLGNSGAIAM